MAWLGGGKQSTILLQRRQINIIPRIIFKNSSISRTSDISIGEHSAHFSITAQIVTFVVPAECTTKSILSTMYWSLITLSLRNIKHNNLVAFNLRYLYIAILQQTDIDSILVVNSTPKILLQLFHIAIC